MKASSLVRPPFPLFRLGRACSVCACIIYSNQTFTEARQHFTFGMPFKRNTRGVLTVSNSTVVPKSETITKNMLKPKMCLSVLLKKVIEADISFVDLVCVTVDLTLR